MNVEKAKKIQKTYGWFRFIIMVAFLLMMFCAAANAQEVSPRQAQDKPDSTTLSATTQEKPKWTSKGKVIVTLFGDFGAQFQEGSKPDFAYNLDRAYLGYQYDYNEHWTVKAVYDMGKGDDKTLQRIGYVKNAEIDYKTGRLGLKMGLTSTTAYNVQEKFWGLRYVYKSYMDERGWESSADLGFDASYQFTKWFSADVAMFNGEGYKKIEMDNHFLYGVGMTFMPAKGLTLRAYADFKTAEDTACQEKVALFAGYQQKAFRMGVEGNMEFNNGNAKGHDLYGVSAYVVGNVSRNWEIFGRYDWGTSEADDSWQYSKDGHVGMVGASWQINKIFAVSPNVRLTKNEGQNLKTYVCLSGKVNL